MRYIRDYLILIGWFCLFTQNFSFAKAWQLPKAKLGAYLQQKHPQWSRIDGLSKKLTLRGGSTSSTSLNAVISSPEPLFNALLTGVAGSSVLWKLADAIKAKTTNDAQEKPKDVQSLQTRFLIVFWLLRMADWLQGPYFYEVYSSKIIGGAPLSLDMVSKLFLMGFATTGLFGPFIGRVVDARGRKLGTLLFVLLYGLSALSTQSSTLAILALGRVAGGLGTSLLFSAPEAWLVGEHQKAGFDGKWLGQTFGWAYSGDALVAITAGQIASLSAAKAGPSGPFTTSIAFLLIGGLLAALSWRENVAVEAATSVESSIKSQSSIGDAIRTIFNDRRILMVGAVQALFEGAMYIFVLQWPPMMKAAIQAVAWPNLSQLVIPYGKIFSCFMACCLLGSSIFGALQKARFHAETSTAMMLTAATLSMGLASALASGTIINIPILGNLISKLGLGFSGIQTLLAVIASFFVFEMCVGMYFPSIGLLRSKYLPDQNRSVIMNLFGLPLNLIVVSVFLSIKSLGVKGALLASTTSLGVASVLMSALALSSKRQGENSN